MGGLKHRTNLGSIKVSAGKFYAKTRYEGKTYFAGAFSSYDGTSSSRIVRLNADGSVDTGFSVGSGFNGNVNAIAVAADGKVYVGGAFTTYKGTSINRIARLNTNGSVDTGFSVGSGFNNTVLEIAVASDGKVYVGGNFTSYNGTSINRIVRLNTNGSIDTGFSVGTGFNSGIYSIAVASDGKVYVGGNFTSYNGTSINRIVRLNTNGSIDTGFNVGTGFNRNVQTIAVASDGKMCAGGSFWRDQKYSIARLNTNGSTDTGFDPGWGFSNYGAVVYTIAIASDGKLYVGGTFTKFNFLNVKNIVRLNTNGSLDTGFSVGSGPNNNVYAIAVAADGKVYVGGAFTTYKGTSALRAIKLNQDGSIVEDFPEKLKNFDNTVSVIAFE